MIILTGGGTGGHLSIINALKQELISRGETIIYIGSTRGQDMKWFAKDDAFSHTYFLESRGFTTGIFAKLTALYHLIKTIWRAISILKKHHATKIISVGGYSAAPCSIAGIVSRVPLYIHEQNAIMGRLNRLCRPFAKMLFCSFDLPQVSDKMKRADTTTPIQNSNFDGFPSLSSEGQSADEQEPTCHKVARQIGEQEKELGSLSAINHRNIYKVNYPINSAFKENARQREKITTILFLGGSQGAKFLNALALEIAPFLKQHHIRIIHQCGVKELEEVSKAYKALDIDADTFSFSSELHLKMQQADFAISRCGATTMWELIGNGLPALFVPYPYAIANHQYHNGKYLSDQNLGFLQTQDDLNRDTLEQLITKLIDPLNQDISKISIQLSLLSSQNGATQMIDTMNNHS